MDKQFQNVVGSSDHSSENGTARGSNLALVGLNLIAVVIAAVLWLTTYFLNETGLNVMLLVLATIAGAALIAIVIGTIKKNRWGINLERVQCPSCSTQLPQLRAPTSVQQALWGGYTCPKCGTQVDKWGRKIR